jgi:hypothetical protein
MHVQLIQSLTPHRILYNMAISNRRIHSVFVGLLRWDQGHPGVPISISCKPLNSNQVQVKLQRLSQSPILSADHGRR